MGSASDESAARSLASRGPLHRRQSRPLLCGVSAPRGEDARLPVRAGDVLGVVGARGTGKTGFLDALRELNPEYRWCVVSAPEPGQRTSPVPVREVLAGPGAGSMATALALEDLHRWDSAALAEIEHVFDDYDVVLASWDPGLLFAAKIPWASRIRRAGAFLCLGPRSGAEQAWWSSPIPASRTEVPVGTGLLMDARGAHRFRFPRVGPMA